MHFQFKGNTEVRKKTYSRWRGAHDFGVLKEQLDKSIDQSMSLQNSIRNTSKYFIKKVNLLNILNMKILTLAIRVAVDLIFF